MRSTSTLLMTKNSIQGGDILRKMIFSNSLSNSWPRKDIQAGKMAKQGRAIAVRGGIFLMNVSGIGTIYPLFISYIGRIYLVFEIRGKYKVNTR